MPGVDVGLVLMLESMSRGVSDQWYVAAEGKYKECQEVHQISGMWQQWESIRNVKRCIRSVVHGCRGQEVYQVRNMWQQRASIRVRVVWHEIADFVSARHQILHS